MTYLKSSSGLICVAALMTATSAFADVTAQDVWDNWMDQMSIYGEEGVTVGSETYAGGVLTVSDLAISMTNPNGTTTASLASIVMTENGDGTVDVTTSEDYPINVNTNVDGVESNISVLLKMLGNKITVSGTPEEMTYAISADRYTVTVPEVIENGEAVPATVLFNLNDVRGNYTVATGEMRNMDYDLSAASADMLISVQDAGSGFDLSGQIVQPSTTGTSSLPLDYDASQPQMMFASGAKIDATFKSGQSQYIIAVAENGATTNITAASSGNSTSFGLVENGMMFDTTTNDLVLNMQGGDFPFPVDLAIKEYGLGFTMPMASSDEPTDFGLRISLTEVAPNDMIWGMADPMGALPHDPITAQIDLKGTATLFYDLMDPAQADQIAMADAPGELNSLQMAALNLIFGGATVTGTGDFTFDNADTTTFDGFPRPEGNLDLRAKGLNGLLDNLQAMGLIPEDQMMGARMMLGMFSTVVGDDELTTKIEVKNGGSVFINSQQIR